MANTKQLPAYPAKVRQKWYFLADKVGKSVDEICGLYFISRKTYYKWRATEPKNDDRVIPAFFKMGIAASCNFFSS